MDPVVPRADRLPRPLIWVLGSIPVAMLFLCDLQAMRGGVIAHSEVWGRDFANVWTGGRLVLLGRLDWLYDVDLYRAFERGLYGHVGHHNYSYPPLALFVDVPFALLPYGVALAVWLVGTGLLFAAAARPWCVGHARWLLLLTPAATVNVWAGHFGFLVGALFLAGWRYLPDRPRLAGLCFGLMVLKPHLAVLVPLILLLRRDWQAIGAAALTVMAAVLVSGLVFGFDLWRQYLGVTAGVQARMIDPGREFYGVMATSIASGLLRDGMPAALAWGLQGCAAAFAVMGVAVAALRRGPPHDLAMLVATATFLVLPYAFNYDLTVVAVAALALFSQRGPDPGVGAIALLAFVAPQLGMVAGLCGVPLLPVALCLLFGVQLRPWISLRPAAPAAAAAAR